MNMKKSVKYYGVCFGRNGLFSLLIVLANFGVFGEMPSIDDLAKSNRIARQPGLCRRWNPDGKILPGRQG